MNPSTDIAMFRSNQCANPAEASHALPDDDATKKNAPDGCIPGAVRAVQPCGAGRAINALAATSVALARPVLTPAIRKRDIAAEAYADALRYLEREFEGNAKATSWLRTVKETSLGDLLETAKQAESRYSQAAQTKPKTVKSWIRGLSSRILYYGKVLDLLSQHHPEYVALVWGVVKFVLIGVINHENLVTQFSKALYWITQALPRCELSAELYQTDEMRDAVAALYAHILLFLQQAVKWYNVGTAGRALTSLFKPFELSYKETLDEIMLCAKTIDDISSLASKVEIREIKDLLQRENTRLVEREERLHEMQRQFSLAQEELTAAVEAVLRIVSCDTVKINEIHVNVNNMVPRVMDIHFNQVLDALKPKRSPEEALQKHKSLIRRASPWRCQNHDNVKILQTVGNWILAPRSSLLVLQTQPKAQARVKEIATELIGQLHSSKVIWYLSSFGAEDHGTISATEVLKSLVFQSMKQAAELVTSEPSNFTAAKLHASHTEDEWADLLCCVLRRLNTCFLIVDAEDVFGDVEEAKRLMSVLAGLMDRFQGMEAVIKLLVVNYRDESEWVGGARPGKGRMEVLVVNRAAPVPPRRRKPGARSGIFRGAEWGRIASQSSPR